MEQHGKVGCNNYSSSSSSLEEDQMELRRGPWTVEEDFTLINYIAHHGEGRWNSLARCAGLKRTGKSCRLRWLNYLRPDVRRGNITLEEQLLILELHSRWGNRWSKIAQHLPGRTDNEIKNYWRTRVQKHAKQLKCDVNSKQFKDTMRYLWMPRLVERIQAAGGGPTTANNNYALIPNDINTTTNTNNINIQNSSAAAAASSDSFVSTNHCYPQQQQQQQQAIEGDHNNNNNTTHQDYYPINNNHHQFPAYTSCSPTDGGYFDLDFNNWIGDVSDNLWNVVDDDDDMWFLHHQFNTNIH